MILPFFHDAKLRVKYPVTKFSANSKLSYVLKAVLIINKLQSNKSLKKSHMYKLLIITYLYNLLVFNKLYNFSIFFDKTIFL